MSLLTKYKPQNLNDLVIPNTAIKDLLDDMANGYVINKLCFVGTNGTGKSTAAHLMPALIEGFPPSTVHLIGEEKFDDRSPDRFFLEGVTYPVTSGSDLIYSEETSNELEQVDLPGEIAIKGVSYERPVGTGQATPGCV